jgi:hypothetical protein
MLKRGVSSDAWQMLYNFEQNSGSVLLVVIATAVGKIVFIAVVLVEIGVVHYCNHGLGCVCGCRCM